MKNKDLKIVIKHETFNKTYFFVWLKENNMPKKLEGSAQTGPYLEFLNNFYLASGQPYCPLQTKDALYRRL